MELWNAILDRKQQIALGLLLSAMLYGVLHSFLDEYVTVLAGGGGAYAGYLIAQRGASGPMDEQASDNASAWGFGVLIGVLTMHTLVQGAVL